MKLLKTPDGLMTILKVSFALCSVERADKSPQGFQSGSSRVSSVPSADSSAHARVERFVFSGFNVALVSGLALKSHNDPRCWLKAFNISDSLKQF